MSDLVSREANDIAAQGIKDILALMRKLGYKMESSKASALYTKTFSKGDRPHFAIDGWHGTGDWGVGKTVFSLYYYVQPEGYSYWRPEEVISLREIFDYPRKKIPGEPQKKVIQDILAYLTIKA